MLALFAKVGPKLQQFPQTGAAAARLSHASNLRDLDGLTQKFGCRSWAIDTPRNRLRHNGPLDGGTERILFAPFHQGKNPVPAFDFVDPHVTADGRQYIPDVLNMLMHDLP